MTMSRGPRTARRFLSILAVGALSLSMSLAVAGEAGKKAEPGKESVQKDKGGKPKAKAGEACKTNDDCDQASPQQCTDSVCRQRIVVHPVT